MRMTRIAVALSLAITGCGGMVVDSGEHSAPVAIGGAPVTLAPGGEGGMAGAGNGGGHGSLASPDAPDAVIGYVCGETVYAIHGGPPVHRVRISDERPVAECWMDGDVLRWLYTDGTEGRSDVT